MTRFGMPEPGEGGSTTLLNAPPGGGQETSRPGNMNLRESTGQGQETGFGGDVLWPLKRLRNVCKPPIRTKNCAIFDVVWVVSIRMRSRCNRASCLQVSHVSRRPTLLSYICHRATTWGSGSARHVRLRPPFHGQCAPLLRPLQHPPGPCTAIGAAGGRYRPLPRCLCAQQCPRVAGAGGVRIHGPLPSSPLEASGAPNTQCTRAALRDARIDGSCEPSHRPDDYDNSPRHRGMSRWAP